MGNGGDGAAIRAPFSGAPSASSRGPGRAYRHEFGTVAGIGFCKLLKYWWPRAELNHRHTDFQSAALPTELLGRAGRAERSNDRALQKPVIISSALL